MLERTDTRPRRGGSIPGDSKRFARVEVMQRGHRGDRGRLRARGFPLPEPLER